jgi:transposase-like protein
MNKLILQTGDSPRSRTAREAFWRNMLADFQRSGQTIAGFCRSRSLSEPSFYAWRKRLPREGQVGQPGQPSTPEGSALSRRAPMFVPVVVAPGIAVDEPIEVQLKGGRVMRLPASLAASRIAEVLHALEGL